MESEHPDGTIDIETLLAELPACKHCRTRRRRCDTKLPSCENCTRAGRECVYYDHVLKEELPRNYITSLIEHLEALEETSQPQSQSEASSCTQAGLEPSEPGSERAGVHSFAFSQGSYRYLGAGSPLLDLRLRHGGPDHSRRPPGASLPSQQTTRDRAIVPAMHGYLLRLFFNSIHQVYPILDPAVAWLSPDAVMGLPAYSTEAFILQMVYAVACHCDHDNYPHLLPLASAAHSRALHMMHKTTAEQSTAALRMAILLVLHTMFDPASGNISQQLGFAIRLLIDLAGPDSDEEPFVLSTLQKIVYCLENSVCGVLVRPTSLPEPSTPLTFDPRQPLDFLCTLYRTQSRIRRKVADELLCNQILGMCDSDSMEGLHPNILSTLWETRLMLDPSATTAAQLISAYSRDGYIATFLTACWMHKATLIVIDAISFPQGPLVPEFMLSYGRATALFGRWSGKWEAASILLRDVQSGMGGERVNVL